MQPFGVGEGNQFLFRGQLDFMVNNDRRGGFIITRSGQWRRLLTSLHFIQCHHIDANLIFASARIPLR